MEEGSIRFIDPKTAIFGRTEGGFLKLHIEPDEDYSRVSLHYIFPFTAGNGYVSVRNYDSKEIGIIRSMDCFSETAKELLREELQRRYFTPVIQRIVSIKEEFGYFYWEVITDAGSKKFTLRREHHSIISITEKRILIIDVDGNRFEISDCSKMEPKFVKVLEMLL